MFTETSDIRCRASIIENRLRHAFETASDVHMPTLTHCSRESASMDSKRANLLNLLQQVPTLPYSTDYRETAAPYEKGAATAAATGCCLHACPTNSNMTPTNLQGSANTEVQTKGSRLHSCSHRIKFRMWQISCKYCWQWCTISIICSLDTRQRSGGGRGVRGRKGRESSNQFKSGLIAFPIRGSWTLWNNFQ